MPASRISTVRGRQIFDSRGRPTVEVVVQLEGKVVGQGVAPSGASTGTFEALELRDGDPRAYEGRGVQRALANVNGEIAAALRGMDGGDQRAIDDRLIELDGTETFRRLGANATIATSMAVCRAAAAAQALQLHAYIASLAGTKPALPMPMVNILSGGAHARGRMDFQDFLAVPVGATSLPRALEMVGAVRLAADKVATGMGLSTLLADEGGLSPELATPARALDFMIEAIAAAGFKPGGDIAIAIDVAASELYDAPSHSYRFQREACARDAAAMIELIGVIARNYPVVSVEDPLDQDAWEDWSHLTRKLGAIQIVGDDLFVTHPDRIARGGRENVGNAVLIKPNQNGTLSGTLKAMAAASSLGFRMVVSARSGETEDAFIADLATGTGAGQIKIGSMRSSERLAKYNQLLRIADDLDIPFAGRQALAGSADRRAAASR